MRGIWNTASQAFQINSPVLYVYVKEKQTTHLCFITSQVLIKSRPGCGAKYKITELAEIRLYTCTCVHTVCFIYLSVHLSIGLAVWWWWCIIAMPPAHHSFPVWPTILFLWLYSVEWLYLAQNHSACTVLKDAADVPRYGIEPAASCFIPLLCCLSCSGRPVHWAGQTLPDRVHAERSETEGLPKRALLRWESLHLFLHLPLSPSFQLPLSLSISLYIPLSLSLSISLNIPPSLSISFNISSLPLSQQLSSLSPSVLLYIPLIFLSSLPIHPSLFVLSSLPLPYFISPCFHPPLLSSLHFHIPPSLHLSLSLPHEMRNVGIFTRTFVFLFDVFILLSLNRGKVQTVIFSWVTQLLYKMGK